MTRSASRTVVELVAESEGVDPLELAYPLADTVDPDALDRLFRDTTGRLAFRYHGYDVTVDSAGGVEVTPVGEE